MKTGCLINWLMTATMPACVYLTRILLIMVTVKARADLYTLSQVSHRVWANSANRSTGAASTAGKFASAFALGASIYNTKDERFCKSS